jgi:putative holliday junction resolvase
MGRLMAVDFGLKRVGLAVTDPLQIIASSLETIPPKELTEYLTAYFKKEKVDLVIFGLPKKLDGTDTNITGHVKGLVGIFRKAFPEIDFTTHDERYTSSIALKAMIASGTSKKERRTKGNLDKVAATIILQSYMESRVLQNRN